MGDRLGEAERLWKEATKLTTPGLLRWSLDWEQATPMFERAGQLFRVGAGSLWVLGAGRSHATRSCRAMRAIMCCRLPCRFTARSGCFS